MAFHPEWIFRRLICLLRGAASGHDAFWCRNLIRFGVLFCCVGFGPPAVSQPITPPGWELQWWDDFPGNSIDAAKWDVIFSTQPTNNSLHAYLPQQVSVADGNLVISSADQPYAHLPYRSGQVMSVAQQQYGRFVIRADLPTSKGMWPAIWLLPDVDEYDWPSQGEIDIMENRGDEPSMTSSAFHWGTVSPYQHWFLFGEQQQFQAGQQVNYHGGFHTYAVEWEPDQIRFFVDDVHHFTVFDAATNGFIGKQVAPMQLVINTAIGGDFLEDPDHTTVWPQQLRIDYVAVYQKSSIPTGMNFENGGFEVYGGSLAHWTTFGNVIPNVVASTSRPRTGMAALKLFGQFNGGLNYSGIEQGITVSPGTKLMASAHAMTSSDDPIFGTANEAFLKVDFYRRRHAAYGSSDYISSSEVVMMNGNSPINLWTQSEIEVIVPAGAVEARAVIVFKQPGLESGSIFVDDVTLRLEGLQPNTWPPIFLIGR